MFEEEKRLAVRATAEELRKCRAEGSVSPLQLLGQWLLVPTSIFGDDPSANLVYEGRVVRRTRGRADRVDVKFTVDGRMPRWNPNIDRTPGLQV